MAFTRTAVCLSLAILTAAFVASTSAARPARPSFCDTAEDKVLCSQLVGKSKTWDQAMTNALKSVTKKAEGGRSVASVVAAKLSKNLKPVTKESIVSTCHDSYDNIMSNLNECIGLVKNDPTSALSYSLSAVSYSDCTDSLAEFSVSVAEATRFEQEMLKLESALLAVAEKKP